MERNTNTKKPNYALRRAAVAALALTGVGAGIEGAQALKPESRTVYAPVTDESWAGRSDVAAKLRKQGARVSDLRLLDAMNPNDETEVNQVGMTFRTDPLGRLVEAAFPPEAFDATGQTNTEPGSGSNIAQGK